MADFDMEAFRARLQELMDREPIKRKPLAKAAGLGETSIRDIFSRDGGNVRAGTLVKLADYFGVSIDELIDTPEVRLGGRVGAGGEVIFEAEEDPEAPQVPRPPGASSSVMALLVVGASMLPKYEDGDIVYVRKEVEGLRPAYIGEYCVIRTSEGGTYLKLLAKGSQPGTYTLRSLNAPDMEDVQVDWASPVRWVMPRAARAS